MTVPYSQTPRCLPNAKGWAGFSEPTAHPHRERQRADPILNGPLTKVGILHLTQVHQLPDTYATVQCFGPCMEILTFARMAAALYPYRTVDQEPRNIYISHYPKHVVERSPQLKIAQALPT